ncbi:MAG: hypothetical protein K0S61_4592 [Anaerocolumna sp.]|jgi:hypothetical protein|nr:hypothetical protein [Anaerocolumna sp.]
MTEEINNLNTDFKELFSENKLDELIEQLNNTESSIVAEITIYNCDIIKKYYDEKKFNLLLQFIKFVAFSSFLWEYSAKRELLDSVKNEEMSILFTSIYELVQSETNQ